jgi:hypothetical protein
MRFNMRSCILASAMLVAAPAAQAFWSISVVGDSLVYRSGWNCSDAGINIITDPAACMALRMDSSFVSYLPYPYSWNTEPVFDVAGMNGVGGSTCFRRAAAPGQAADPGLLRRLRGLDGSGFQYAGESKVAVLIGINDVNGHGKSIAQTVSCLRTGWSYIANSLKATPVVLTYPPVSTGTAVWGIGPQAASNATALNLAIQSAVHEFNASQLAYGGKQADLVTLGNAYNPATHTTDGVHPNPAGAEVIARYIFWRYH